MVEQCFTQEQLGALAARRAAYGDEQIADFEQQWTELIARAEGARAAGVDATREPILAIAREWMGLVHAFTGVNAGIERPVERVWQEEDEVHGFDASVMRALIAWLAPAVAHIESATP